MKRPSPQAAIEYLKSANIRYCLHPQAPTDCSGKIVQAHTIQRNGGLSAIAQNEKVGHFDYSFGSLLSNNGKVRFKEVSTKSASTFTGFCSFHDNQTFKPVEDCVFSGSSEQVFLLGYRALCRELYAKRQQMETMEYLRSEGDKGRSIPEQVAYQEKLNLFLKGVKAGLADLEHSKQRCDAILMSRDFSPVRGLVLQTNIVPSTLVSGAWFPDLDFNGNALADYMNLESRLGHMAVVSIPTDSGGVFILSWLDPNPESQQFAQSLESIPAQEQPDALLRFVYRNFENTFFSIEWWENLSSYEQQVIRGRVESNANWNEEPVGLEDDGIRVADFKILGTQRIGW